MTTTNASPSTVVPCALDLRFMAAAIRLSERHVGLTATNPSVATLIVRDDGEGPRIVGRGITAEGGRPHAEAQALAEAGGLAAGATAYVTLEPCAHHGRTPPCAEALVAASVSRVVAAAADPDPRVNGQGHAILRRAGLEVHAGVMAEAARRPISGYLMRHARKRPEVTLKMAISADRRIGLPGKAQVRISGPVADRQIHLLRARSDAILVGRGTLAGDDPLLTCRLPGLEPRSPARIVLDPWLKTDAQARVVVTARDTRTILAAFADADPARRGALARLGCEFVACERDPLTGGIALPELLEDLAATGISSLLVEGGAATASSFLEADLVDRLVLVYGAGSLGADGISAPAGLDEAAARLRRSADYRFGADRWMEWERTAA